MRPTIPVKRLSRHIPFALLPALLAVAGCNFEGEELGLAVNSCDTDEQCPQNATCLEGICVTEEATPLRVVLKVTPVYSEVPTGNGTTDGQLGGSGASSGGEPLSVLGEPFLVEGPTELDDPIEVPPSVEVSGNIRNGEQPVPARISFLALDRVEGVQTDPITTTTTEEPQNDSTEQPADFVIRVLRNVAYEVVVQPLEESEQGSENSSLLPPLFTPTFTAEKSPTTRLDINFEDISILERRFLLADAPPGLYLEIHAVSQNDTRKTISSSSRIQAQEGGTDFSLLFSPDAGPYQLVLSPLPEPVDADASSDGSPVAEARTPVFPVFRVNDADLSVEGGGVGPAAEPLAPRTVRIPALPASVTFSASIEMCERSRGEAANAGGNVLPENTEPPSLPVSLRSVELLLDDEQTALEGSFNITASAALDPESGQSTFSVVVMPGEYEVVVTPPLNGACGLFARRIAIQAPEGGGDPEVYPIQIPGMAVIEGDLLTRNGEAVLGATIQAQTLSRDGIDQSEEPSVTRYNRSAQTTTDAEGAFRLPLDLGSYDLIAKPPEGTGFAWQVLKDVDIGSRDQSFRRSLELAAPVPVEGSIRIATADDGAGAVTGPAGAEIRAFTIIDDIADGKRSIAIGRATADADGNFTLLLSPALYPGLY